MGRKGGTGPRPTLGRCCVSFRCSRAGVASRSNGDERARTGGVASGFDSPCPHPYFAGMPPRRRTSKDTPAKLASGDVVFRHACKLGLEGIVSKRLGSPYRSGRSPDWLKMKNPAAPAVKREAEEEWGKEKWW
jgi:hypothetical protein